MMHFCTTCLRKLVPDLLNNREMIYGRVVQHLTRDTFEVKLGPKVADTIGIPFVVQYTIRSAVNSCSIQSAPVSG